MTTSKQFLRPRAVLLVLALIIGWAVNDHAQSVAVILDKNYSVFQETERGFRSTFLTEYPDAEFSEFDYQKQKQDLLQLMIMETAPDIVFTIGHLATQFAIDRLAGFPVVFAMVSSPPKYDIIVDGETNSSRISGVTVDVDCRIVIEFLQDLFGEKINITTIYSDNSFARLSRIKDCAGERDIPVISYPVMQAKLVPDVLKKVKEKTIFWILPDPFLYTSETLHVALRTLNRQGVTILAPTVKFLKVENGAHLAVSVVPAENGRQAASIAIRMLRWPEKVFPVENPKAVQCFVKEGMNIRSHEDINWID